MDAENFSCDRKGIVLNPKNYAFASPQMNGSYLKKDLPFSFSSFGRIFSSGTELSYPFSGRFRPMRFLALSTSFVTFSHMLFLVNPFKVIRSIIGFVTIDMVNKMRVIWAFKPASGNHSMVERPANIEISRVCSSSGCKGFELSKNFPTMRNSIKVAKESIFDSIYRCAHHVVPFRGYINGKVS